MSSHSHNCNLPPCDTICVGGRRCTSDVDFAVYRSTGPNKPQLKCTTHALGVYEFDAGVLLVPISEYRYVRETYRCSRRLGGYWNSNNEWVEGSVRCDKLATFHIVSPDGNRPPGCHECSEHAIETVTEYMIKLVEAWTLEAIE